MTETIKVRGVTCAVTDCITCGVVFTVPLNAYEAQRRQGGYHSCPNGHQQGWAKHESEEGRIRRERDRLKQEQAWYEERLRQECDRAASAERRTAAARGQITKLTKRAAAGVCPCCNRTFQDLARHMAGQHPEFMSEPDATAHVH